MWIERPLDAPNFQRGLFQLSRVDESDILTATRALQGLERMEQIKYAILERSGGISIIPMPMRPDLVSNQNLLSLTQAAARYKEP